mgnify:CR=1 FL=1|jgi:hypothetical protein
MASILKVDSIGKTSGSTQDTMAGLAKCWGDYDQDTPSVKDSFNTSSITDHTTGQYDPQWSSNMSSVNYVTMSQSQPQSTVTSCESFEDESAKTTSDTRIQTIENASATDHTNNGYVVSGDLA